MPTFTIEYFNIMFIADAMTIFADTFANVSTAFVAIIELANSIAYNPAIEITAMNMAESLDGKVYQLVIIAFKFL